jgi:hypothetical protein
MILTSDNKAHQNNILRFSTLAYLKENATLHHYIDDLINAVYGNGRYLHRKSYETYKYIPLAKCVSSDCQTSGTHSYHWTLND